MAIVDLEFVGLKSLEGHVTIDGKYVKLKKKKNKYFCTVETDKEQCEVIVYKSHVYTGNNWLLWNILYFVISCFGLLDFGLNNKCLVQDARFSLACKQDVQAVIRRQNFEDGGAMVKIETTAQVTETVNRQYYDKDAKRKHNMFKKVKLGVGMVAAIALAILFAVL